MKRKIEKTISLINDIYANDNKPWFVAFSGGKDSTLVLLLIIEFIKKFSGINKDVSIVYCDTGVEIPIMRDYTIETLRRVEEFSKKNNLNLKIIIAQPDIKDSFFVNVIGKGYVPPSFMFRWCTDRLRTRPLQKVTNNSDNIIVLGTRLNESNERNRVLETNKISEFIFKQKNYSHSTVFSPIINYDVDEVWNAIDILNNDEIIDLERLRFLYKGFVGAKEESEENPGGRYGCWVCTVVRKDKAGENLIKKGFTEIKHLMAFREILIDYKNDPLKRLPNTKTNVEGKGPFKLNVRKELLIKLLKTQELVGYQLISNEEMEAIYDLWRKEAAIK